MIDRMQELLEAERAGVRCLAAMADEAPEGEKKNFLVFLRDDEGRFCAGLFRLIQERGEVPTDKVGSFAEKVLAIEGEAERLALLIKGQVWVVRKIDEIPTAEMTPDEKSFFDDMHKAHVVNIEACRKYLPSTE
ncbi:MAG: 2-nitropropane dioxygenase [Deltaproteobacteria bacterium]|nr:2-nitropropane dioxygenase [Deltaproteobacteria bacterium]